MWCVPSQMPSLFWDILNTDGKVMIIPSIVHAMYVYIWWTVERVTIHCAHHVTQRRRWKVVDQQEIDEDYYIL